MTLVTLDSSAELPRKLESLGLKMPTLAGGMRLDAESWFEPPLFVQAAIADPTRLRIGAFTSISGGRLDNVEIGRYCAIAPDVVIGAHEHPTDWLTCSRVAYFPQVHGWDQFCAAADVAAIRDRFPAFPESSRTVRVGHDVWIGQGAFVRSGVTIGDGAVIAARSVVVGDVPPYAVMAGVPARLVRYRFPAPLIERLQVLRWWRFSLYDMAGVPFDRIEEAVTAIEQKIGGGEVLEWQPRRYTPALLKMAAAA